MLVRVAAVACRHGPLSRRIKMTPGRIEHHVVKVYKNPSLEPLLREKLTDRHSTMKLLIES